MATTVKTPLAALESEEPIIMVSKQEAHSVKMAE